MHAVIGLLIIVGVILLIILKGLGDLAHHRIRRHGWFVYVYRWFTGLAWHGEPMTNATGRRKGTKALTKTGYAARFYFWPRWQRALVRGGGTIAPIFIVYGLIVAPRGTAEATGILVLGLFVAVGWIGYRAIKRRVIRREWLDPLHSAVAPLADVPLSARPSSWLDVKIDRSRAVLHLPPGYRATEKQREHLAELAAKKLGMEDPEATWKLSGGQPTLALTAAEPPPATVTLDAVRRAFERAAQNELILGLGKKNKPVVVSLHDDSPHLGLSMRSGAGKSTLARYVAAQALHRGAIVLILDIKRISHPWARGLPNVMYADTPELIHDALIWLAGTNGELDRRNQVALYSSDFEGNISASVGPRILVVAEELNMTLGKLRSYWIDTLGGRGVSPAILALQDVAFAGRQVMINLFMVGQMLSARATGGGEARENVGVRMLARYTKRNWEMLVPEFEMPPVSPVVGRIQVVASGEVHETQVVYTSGAEARELAMSGTVSPLPYNVPPSLIDHRMHNVPDTPQLVSGRDDQQNVSGKAETVSDYEPVPVTLSEAVDMGFVRGNLMALKKARQRDKTFPMPVDRPPGGNQLAHYYNPLDLADWQASKDKK